MPDIDQPSEALLTVGEAARATGVSAVTIRRYSDSGRLRTFRTPTNHRRFREADVRGLLTQTATVEPSA